MILLVTGVIGFSIGSFVPNRLGGILALVSGLLVVFLFLFTASSADGVNDDSGLSKSTGTAPKADGWSCLRQGHMRSLKSKQGSGSRVGERTRLTLS